MLATQADDWVRVQVLAFLDGRGVASFAMVSKACNAVGSHEGLWKILLSKRWKVEEQSDEDEEEVAEHSDAGGHKRRDDDPPQDIELGQSHRQVSADRAAISWRALYKHRELVAAPILSLIYFRDHVDTPHQQLQQQTPPPSPSSRRPEHHSQPQPRPVSYKPVGLGLLTLIHKVIVQNCHFTERRLASDALSHLVEADRQMPHLLITVIQQEVLAELMTDEADENGLREESVYASATWVLLKRKLCGAPSLASDLFYSYAKLVGLPFLKSVLSPIVSLIMNSTLSLTIQIAALPAAETKQQNVNACCDFLRDIVVSMSSAIAQFPMQLRLFFRQLRDELQRLFPEPAVADACFADVALNLLFNKFVLPALLRPETFGLPLADDPDQRHAQTRKLVLITRILSGAAENRPFSEVEADYLAFNSFISSDKMQSTLHKFILQLSEVDAASIGDSFYDPLRWNDIEASLRFLYRIIDNNIIDIRKAISSSHQSNAKQDRQVGQLVPLSPVPHPLGSSRNRPGVESPKSPSRFDLHKSYGTSRYLLHKTRGIVPPRRAYSAPVPRGVSSFAPSELSDLLQAQLRKIEDLLRVHSTSMIFDTLDSDPLDVLVDMPPPPPTRRHGGDDDGRDAARHCSFGALFSRGLERIVNTICNCTL